MSEYIVNEEYNWTFPDFQGGTTFESNLKDASDINQLKADLEFLKAEYANKIQLANNLILKLKGSTSIVNSDLIEVIRDIINKVSLHLIKKEIQADPTLITKIIEEFVNILPYKNGLITVYLSKEDLDGIGAMDNQSIVAKSHPDFTRGDIVIKSNSAEIRALLSERIELLTKDHHA